MQHDYGWRNPFLIGRLTAIEKWRNVVGWEGLYAVSNLGRVRSLDRTLPDGRRLSGRFMKPQLSTPGYPMLHLCRGGKYTKRTIHSLVAEAFIGPRPDGMVVNHKDSNRINPAVWNLEYLTPSENVQHMHRSGAYPSVVKRHPYRVGKAVAIAALAGASNKSIQKIAAEAGVSRSTISRILKNPDRYLVENQHER